jgi:type I restriction enzyme S subunit
MKWSTLRVDDIKADCRYACVGGPFGSELIRRDYVEDGVPVVRGVNLASDGQFLDAEFVFVSEQKANKLIANTAQRGDIVFTQRGTLGQVGLIPKDAKYDRYIISQSQMKLTVDESKVLSKYVFYFFRQKHIVNLIIRRAITSGVPHINLGILKSLEVIVPPVDVQQRIVGVLDAYSEAIENNRRRIELLEQSVRLLFREWFVYLRYPGHEHETVVEGVPREWAIEKFSNLVDFKEGPGLRNYQYREQGIPFLNIRTFGDDEIDLSKTQHLDENEVAKKYEHFLVEEDDHVVSSSGTLGRVVTIRKCHLPLMLNTSVIRMRPMPPMTKWFLKAYLKHGPYLQSVTAMATGAAQLNYGPMHLKMLEVLMPNETLVQVFEDIATPIYTQIKILLDTNMQLQRARDLLLPRLMDGKLAV